MDGLGYVRILFWQQSGQIFVVRRDYFIVYTYSKIKKRGNRLFLYYVNLKFRINFDPTPSSSSPIISFNDSCPRHSRLPKDIGLSITRFPRIEDKIENTREKLAARNQGIQFRVGEEPRCSSIGLDRSRRLEPNKYRSSSPYESEIDSREIEASMCLLQFR